LPIQDLFSRAQWGKSSGPTKGVWYRVSFETPFLDEPSVVIIGVARTGRLITRGIEKVTAAKVAALEKLAVAPVAAPGKITVTAVAAVEKIAAVKIAKFEIPRIDIDTADEMGRKVGDAYRDKARERLGDWGWAFNWARDLILSAVWALGYITGTWIHWMYTILVQPQVDNVRDAVNKAISDQVDRINSALSSQVDRINTRISDLRNNVNSTLSAQVDRINTRLGDLRNNVNTALSMDQINARFSTLVDNINAANSSQVDRVVTRVNAVLADLYDSWGLPSGVVATPVHVRNVSTSGFEWQSYGGTTIYWIAMGKTRTKLFELPELPIRRGVAVG